MLTHRLLLFAGLATITACASSPAPTAASQPAAVEYFVGTVTTTSPDGATPYGPPSETVACRRVGTDGATIEEDVFHDGRLGLTRLKPVGDRMYEASDDAGSFSGKVVVEGDESFLWPRWTYQIEMTDGSGSITGTGSRTPEGFSTEKLFTAGGAPRARITEVFRTVSKEEFEEKLRTLEDAVKAEAPSEG